jgi:hypothetical protein
MTHLVSALLLQWLQQADSQPAATCASSKLPLVQVQHTAVQCRHLMLRITQLHLQMHSGMLLSLLLATLKTVC